MCFSWQRCWKEKPNKGPFSLIHLPAARTRLGCSRASGYAMVNGTMPATRCPVAKCAVGLSWLCRDESISSAPVVYLPHLSAQCPWAHRDRLGGQLPSPSLTREWLRLERDLKVHPLPTPHRGLTTHQIRLPSAPSNLPLSTSRNWASTLGTSILHKGNAAKTITSCTSVVPTEWWGGCFTPLQP